MGDRLAKEILSGEIHDGDTVHVLTEPRPDAPVRYSFGFPRQQRSRFLCIADFFRDEAELRRLWSDPATRAALLGELDQRALWVPATTRTVAEYRRLDAEARTRGEVTPDEQEGWCLADADDRPQWLLGIHRTSALRQGLERLGSPRDRSLRELFAEATLVTLPASRDDVADIDTWAELARWAERLEHPQEPASEPGQQEER